MQVVEGDCVTGQILPGGEERGIDCLTGLTTGSVLFKILTVSDDARLCYRTTQSARVWVNYLAGQGVQCDPEVCGAAQCVTNTKYLFQSFTCDEACCFRQCDSDPNCRFFNRYDRIGQSPGTFRLCQTVSTCSTVNPPLDISRIPFIKRKVQGIEYKWEQAQGGSFKISPPSIEGVTVQRRPAAVLGMPFTVNIQGTALASSHVQVHVKLVRGRQFNGGCNNVSASNEAIYQLDSVATIEASVAAHVKEFKNLSASGYFNGTCGGGKPNCVGGPAPPGTVCRADIDCIPQLGGVCTQPNTGMSCLFTQECTFGGVCNNSKGELTLTPSPTVPTVILPFDSLNDQVTMPSTLHQIPPNTPNVET